MDCVKVRQTDNVLLHRLEGSPGVHIPCIHMPCMFRPLEAAQRALIPEEKAAVNRAKAVRLTSCPKPLSGPLHCRLQTTAPSRPCRSPTQRSTARLLVTSACCQPPVYQLRTTSLP